MTPDQKTRAAALAAQAQAAGAADPAAIAAWCNAPRAVPNPAPRADVPSPLRESRLLALLTDPDNGSAVKLLNWVNFGLLKADIAAGNRAAVRDQWCPLLAGAGLVTQGECDAIHAYLGATEPDPDWPAEVALSPWRREFGDEPVTVGAAGATLAGYCNEALVAEALA